MKIVIDIPPKHLKIGCAICGLIAVVFTVWLIWYYEILPKPQLEPSPTWNGITPGQTTYAEAVEILGAPDHRESRNSYYLVLIYIERPELDWDRLEIWIDLNDNTVGGIFFGILKLDSPDRLYLEEFVLQYGRPDRVTWTSWAHSRYLVWARQGVAISANSNLRLFTWETMSVYEIVYFDPMGVREFFRTHWPWPNIGSGPSLYNEHAPGKVDAPDTYPENPYDWENMPAPTP